MWSIMCSPISTVITQWDSRGLSMVGRSIALHFACNILECKICIVPMLLKVLEHRSGFRFFPNFVCLKTCSSGCDSCPDHQHDWRGSFPCYCKAFGGDNRSSLPQILVLKFVHCWVLSSSLSKFVVAISCHFLFWIDTLVMILWRPEPWPFHSLSGFQGGRSLTDFSRRRALPRQRDGCFRSEWLRNLQNSHFQIEIRRQFTHLHSVMLLQQGQWHRGSRASHRLVMIRAESSGCVIQPTICIIRRCLNYACVRQTCIMHPFISRWLSSIRRDTAISTSVAGESNCFSALAANAVTLFFLLKDADLTWPDLIWQKNLTWTHASEYHAVHMSRLSHN